MKYNNKIFDSEVNYYIGRLKGKVKNKPVFVAVGTRQTDAFYSIAPLSKAVHESGGDMHVIVEDEGNSLSVLKDIWHTYEDYLKGLKTKTVRALFDFINAVNRRTKKDVFKEVFKEPEIILRAEKDGFRGTTDLDYKCEWHKRYKEKELIKTATRILKEGYNLKKGERIGIGFVLVPKNEHLELPLEDYLDSYSIAFAMASASKKLNAKPSLSSCTDRTSALAKSVRTADLLMALKGCELDKDVDEEVFRRYKLLSKLLKIGRLKFISAGFGIHAKGYYGKHFFGEEIGYPSLDKKTRWSSPGQLMLKDVFSPQTALEKRDPMMRYAITETLPIDIFIETCNIDYGILRKRSNKIRNILDKCDYIKVVGKEIGNYKTDLIVNLLNKDGKRQEFIPSDCDVRSIVDKENYKKTGIKAGTYANFPSGEAFVTPASVKGLMVGDVVINIDRSYVIPDKSPIIVKFNGNSYKVIKAPMNILKTMRKEWGEARQRVRDYEKNKSLPKEIVGVYKKNFWNIGEFAINTNPKAKLCNYLIVNEKIARMIHIALGFGFDAKRKTVYHWDIVVNSPRQKLDIYGVDKKNKIHWVIRKGEFAV